MLMPFQEILNKFKLYNKKKILEKIRSDFQVCTTYEPSKTILAVNDIPKKKILFIQIQLSFKQKMYT